MGTRSIGHVNRHHIPGWMKAIGEQSGCKESLEMLSSGWMDHCGTVETDRGSFFVSEPYELDQQAVAELVEFASKTKCTFTIEGRGSHHRDTFRITIYPPPHADEFRYASQPQCSGMDEEEEFTHVIYGLIDPRDGLFYYVGQTTDSERRLKQHLDGRDRWKKGRYQWFEEMRAAHVKPQMVILDRATYSNFREKEREWISKLRFENQPLVNKEYGPEINASQQEWIDMGRHLRQLRAGIIIAHDQLLNMVRPKHKVHKLINECWGLIDKTRQLLEAELFSIWPEWPKAGDVFYGEDSYFEDQIENKP